MSAPGRSPGNRRAFPIVDLAALGDSEPVAGRANHFLLYHDVFGGWRWEWRDAHGDMHDSINSYGSCTEALEKAQELGLATEAPVNIDATGRVNHFGTAAVLCAHPDSAVPSFLRSALAPVDVAFASNAYEALKSINASAFDAYVLDYWLTDWTGVGLCREIRKIDPNVPICIYSKLDTDNYQKRALRAGADLVLTMPQDPASFRDSVEILLRSREKHIERARLETERAIQAELDRQARFMRKLDKGGRAAASPFLERKVRTTARKAFIGAGGTCANFERTWQQVYAQTARALGSHAAYAA